MNMSEIAMSVPNDMKKWIDTLKTALESFEQHRQQWGEPSKVTVIIPVYNAPEDTAECLASVLTSAASVPFDIVVSDDASPDLRVAELLTVFDQETCSGIRVFRHETNRGFSGNCNYAMAEAVGDVILLNSDTIVPVGWLDAMHATALSDSLIASVTPWSNSGFTRICDDEKWFVELCESVSVGKIQECLNQDNQISLPPRLFTGVGLCMYLKRNALEEVGLFDEQAFPQGYGEESDWCMRAAECGFIHVLDTQTFVFHKVGKSFQEKRDVLRKRASRMLKDRYPQYSHAIQRAARHDPLIIARNEALIRIVRGLAAGKSGILLAMHSQTGGSFEFVKRLSSQLKERFAFHVVRYCDEEGMLKWFYLSGESGMSPFMTFSVTRQSFASMLVNPSQPEHQEALRHLMALFNIRLVHVQHTLTLGIAPVFAAAALGLPCIFVAHDYYTLHPNYKLFDDAGNRLDLAVGNPLNSKWFEENTDGRSEVLTGWVRVRRELLGKIDRVVFPSPAAQKTFSAYAPELKAEQAAVIEHPAFQDYEMCRVSEPEFDPAAPLRVLFLGAFTTLKGANIFQECADQATADDGIDFMVLGSKNLKINSNNIRYLGSYARTEVISKIRASGAHLVCVLSIWPETFCHTLTEAWLAGLPVIVTPQGALQDRVRRNNGGWVLQDQRSQTLLSLLRTIRETPDCYMQKRLEITAIQHQSEEKNARAYKDVYTALLQQKTSVHSEERFKEAWYWARGVMHFATASLDKLPTWQRRYERVEHHIVTGSLIKMLRRIKRDPSF